LLALPDVGASQLRRPPTAAAGPLGRTLGRTHAAALPLRGLFLFALGGRRERLSHDAAKGRFVSQPGQIKISPQTA
jgi:hypothetical protein